MKYLIKSVLHLLPILIAICNTSYCYSQSNLGPIDPGVILIWGPNYKNLELNGIVTYEEERNFARFSSQGVPFFFKIKDRPRNYLGFDCDNSQLVYFRYSGPQETVRESRHDYLPLNISKEECIAIIQEAVLATPERPFAIELGEKSH